MEAILVPIFICVVLPIAVVLIVSLTKINGDNKRSQIIIKAIEANKDVDTDKLIESLKKPLKTARQLMLARLLRGCIFSLGGAVLVIIGLINWAIGSVFIRDSAFLLFIFGGISIAIGASYLIVYNVTRRQVDSTDEQ